MSLFTSYTKQYMQHYVYTIHIYYIYILCLHMLCLYDIYNIVTITIQYNIMFI